MPLNNRLAVVHCERANMLIETLLQDDLRLI
jgi:hypothetical protein